MTADDVILLLKLQPHPVEGGFFRETYRATATVPAHGGTRAPFEGDRPERDTTVISPVPSSTLYS